ncbi:UNVERIFIED_ORG: hypothetical protein BCL66_102189 [Martelella mediterranea]
MSKLQQQLCTFLRQSLEGGPKVPFPEAGQLIWQWFADLSRARTWHMSGPNPISHSEIEAYARLSGWPIRADHVGIIAAMDQVFLACSSSGANASTRNKGMQPARSTRPMTATLFDAIFE